MQKLAMMEALEQRRLLSASLGMLFMQQAPPLGIMAVQHTQTQTAKPKVDPLTQQATPNLVGDWTGRLKMRVLVVTKTFPFTLHITDQTADSVTGTITIRGKTDTGTVHVDFKGLRYRTEYHDDDIDATLSGIVNKKGNTIVGDVRGKAFGFSGKGGIEVHRKPTTAA